MSEKSDYSRLEFILARIIEIEKIIQRHDSIKNALDDFEGYNALLMCLLQIGESINKIKSGNIQKFLPVKESISVRNIIAHDYEGVNLEIIALILSKRIPELHKHISDLLKKE
jgi:uncharacterized protein with HEPN domain